jgi:DNA (cytosine-5)-methyltransferase 1
MADGFSRRQRGFNFPSALPTSALRPGEIVVDLFAGGGGASEALRQALGRDPDIAINHDPWAIGMHSANHPLARHLCEDVWHADPRREVGDRRVGWLHASPDCTHFSQAKGGQPRSRATRSLSWVVLKWAGAVAPRIISLENVEQILKWGPLVAKRDRATGRVLRLDGTVAARGERVPIGEQFLIPDPKHAGRTWRQFTAALRALGYAVEHRKLRACDYGAGTSRTRLFMIARRDGEPIRWPAPTHGPGLVPFVTAADCIDWSIATRSIFDRPKPHAKATCRRIARGVQRYILEAPEPFIVPNNTNNTAKPVSKPLPTVTTCGARNLLVIPSLIQAAHGEGTGKSKRRGSGAHDLRASLGTIHAGGGSFALTAATLVQTGYGERVGQEPRVPGLAKPLGTFVDGVKHAVVTANLLHLRNNCDARSLREPLRTLSAGGEHHAVMTAFLEQANGGFYTGAGTDVRNPHPTICSSGSRTRLISAFLVKSYSNGGQWSSVGAPLGSITTKDRMGLVQIAQVPADIIAPELLDRARACAHFLHEYLPEVFPEAADLVLVGDYVIVDIGLRMLKPHELFKAQGFPTDYVIDRTADGRTITGTRAVRMVGNSVSPPPLRALAAANMDPLDVERREAA